MDATETISASDFKARCLEILDRLGRRELARVVVTKRGKVVAEVVPPTSSLARPDQLHGLLRGSVVIPPDVDLTAPVLDKPFDAAKGVLHR